LDVYHYATAKEYHFSRQTNRPFFDFRPTHRPNPGGFSMQLSRLMSLLMSAAALAVVTPAFAQESNATKAADDAAIPAGTYVATAGSRDGKPLTEEQIKGVTFRFDADKMVITDRSGKEIHKCTHTIDKSSTPWKINMKMQDTSGTTDKTAVGLIQRDGETVSIIYPLAGGETPTEFKTKEKQEMYVLKLQK
jgi:uncharacterized protein (TIGR03067 family)